MPILNSCIIILFIVRGNVAISNVEIPLVNPVPILSFFHNRAQVRMKTGGFLEFQSHGWLEHTGYTTVCVPSFIRTLPIKISLSSSKTIIDWVEVKEVMEI